MRICKTCGNEKFSFGPKEFLCPWCDEARMIEISKEQLRKNRVRINRGLIKKGKVSRN